MTDPNTVNYYRNKALTTLGIGFLATGDGAQNLSGTNISLKQLLRTINSISEELEGVLRKWYRQLLIDKGLGAEYAPLIQVIDSEQLDMEIRKELATTLYTLFNGSMQTSLEIMGIDVEDEAAKRAAENEAGYEKIFYPRDTAYTSSGRGEIDPDKGGRPSNKDETEKQKYDEEYNETGRV